MRFTMIVKPWNESEHGAWPSQQMLDAIHRYSGELMKAGVLLDETITGHWIIQVRSKDEALEWARRAPLGVELAASK